MLWTFRVTWTHWLNYMFVFYGNFRFLGGIQIILFCHRSRIHRSTQCIIFCLTLFKKMIWIVPYANWMFKLLVLHNFLCLNSFTFYICYYVAVKKEKNKMSFKSSIGLSCPIPEITTHVFRLKWLETQLIKDQVFF